MTALFFGIGLFIGSSNRRCHNGIVCGGRSREQGEGQRAHKLSQIY